MGISFILRDGELNYQKLNKIYDAELQPYILIILICIDILVVGMYNYILVHYHKRRSWEAD